MGDCLSRPNLFEQENHFKSQNSENNSFFFSDYSFPAIESYIEKDLKSKSDEVDANNFLYYLNFKIPDITMMMNSLKKKVFTEESKLLIEIQKGKDIIPNVSCFYRPRPYVAIELSPTKLTYRSGTSKAYIPNWNQIYKHEAGIKNIKKIVFQVKFNNDFIEDSLFGTAEIDFTMIKDSEIFQEWVKIKPKEKCEGNPEIKVKIQSIENFKEFNEKQIKYLEEIVEIANKKKIFVEEKLKKFKEDGEEKTGNPQ